MNQTAGQLFHHIDGERDVEELASVVGVDVDVARLGVQELVEAGLVTFEEADGTAVSRRGLLKKIGVGTAAATALPIVETIVAPTRAAASSLPGETEAPTPFPTEAATPIPTAPPLETMAPTPEPTSPPTPAPTRAPKTVRPDGRIVFSDETRTVGEFRVFAGSVETSAGRFEASGGGSSTLTIDSFADLIGVVEVIGFPRNGLTALSSPNGGTIGYIDPNDNVFFMFGLDLLLFLLGPDATGTVNEEFGPNGFLGGMFNTDFSQITFTEGALADSLGTNTYDVVPSSSPDLSFIVLPLDPGQCLVVGFVDGRIGVGGGIIFPRSVPSGA